MEIKLIAVVGMVAVLAIALAAQTAANQQANAACSGNPHDSDSGPTGNPHDNGESGNPHDTSNFRHHEIDNCPGSK